MQTIMTHSIPKIFSGYAAILYEENDGTTGDKSPAFIRQTKYHCHCCGTDFSVQHQWHGGLYYGGGSFGDFILYCPYCGHRHENFTRRHQIYTFNQLDHDSKEAAPFNINLTLIEYKQGFILRMNANTLTMRRDIKEVGRIINHFGKRIEEIRFNIKNHLTTFTILTGSHRVVLKQYPIGNPFDTAFYEDSLLKQIQSDNLSEGNRTGTVSILKTLRDNVRRKWKEIHGYDIGSLFASYGQVNGRMLFPIMNLAFRLQFPDAPNLPQYLNTTTAHMKIVKKRRMITEEMKAHYNIPTIAIKGKNSITAIIEMFGLPDKPMVRKLLTEDFFAAPELVKLFRVTDNIDHAAKIWNIMREKTKPEQGAYYTSYKYPREMYDFLLELKDHYPTRSLIAMLKRYDWRFIMDIKDMLGKLAVDRRKNAWQVKLKDLHDWLVFALKEQKEKGCKIEVLEPLKRRLTMQLDSVKFFLPEHTKELAEASNELHNCVRTYSDRVMSGACNIVLMTDDLGKLVACLEVAGGRLVQAKLKHNKRVADNAVINKAVIDWCEKAKLEIATSDVSQRAPAYEAITPVVEGRVVERMVERMVG